jgi:threonine dehydratase
VHRAGRLLGDVAERTPVQRSRWLEQVLQAPVTLKCEHLQRTGSFKIRGAYVRIAGLPPDARRRGVVAASAGNHAQGVALAATLLDTQSTVFMPRGAPIPKERATRGYGADVHFAGSNVDEALIAARAFASRTGAVGIHPFDHPDVVAGQGTLGLEILEQVPDVATVLVPCGGGGLLAGVATAIKAVRPEVRVVGVQAEEAASYPTSLDAGHPCRAAVHAHHGRRHRRGSSRRRAIRGGAQAGRRHPHRQRGVSCHARCCCCSSVPNRSSSPAGRPPSRRCSSTARAARCQPGRSSRCCPAATSIRCC